jgi:nucleoside 2-deoxyribosyltransferase
VIRKGFKCLKADDFKTNTNKLNEIVRNIWQSEFIIADITGLNPNVMYELGFAHAMKKEVIIIYEDTDNDLESKFPFDIQYIEIIKYKNDALGGITLQEDLEKTIHYVRGIIAKSKDSEMKKKVKENEDLEYKYSVISNFQIRVRRIDYLTIHTISHLSGLKKRHDDLIDLMNICRRTKTHDNHDRIISRVEDILNYNNYCYDFAKGLINTSSNFISNAWIVNKFLDYFFIFAMPLNRVKESSVSSFEDWSIFSGLIEQVRHNQSDLDFCIEALNDERKLVGLELVKEKK